MKFATIGHLIDEKTKKEIPKSWIHNNLIVFPEINVNESKGYLTALMLTAQQIMELPREISQKKYFECRLICSK